MPQKDAQASSSAIDSSQEPGILISGTIREYDGDKWKDAKVKVTRGGQIICSGISTKFQIKLPKSKVAPSRVVNAPGVFNLDINTETKYYPGDLLAAPTAVEGEKWINTLKYARCLKIRSVTHEHPLNESNVASCSVCDIVAAPGTIIEGKCCMFCGQYEICKDCFKFLDNLPRDMLRVSLNHPEHDLMLVDSAKEIHVYDPKQEVMCNKCREISTDSVYYCPRCEFVECMECARKAENLLTTNTGNTPMQLELNFMKDYFTSDSADRFKFSVKQSQRTAPHMAIKSNRSWDLSKIDTTPVREAYFEVTFHQLDDAALVSVGVANQIFVQNKLLGDQQNSYGYFNNGKASMNSLREAEDRFAKYSNGDTIGVGMLLDSFNQRKLFFTKNGQMINSFSKNIHKGMDCFPAVSFSRDSKIDFSVNFTGPFKFDLNSIPDYRSDRSCKIESLPQEILIKCFSQAAQSPAQVCEWRTVSKTIGPVIIDNLIWQSLYFVTYPQQNPDLKVKNWLNFFKRRYQAWKEKTTSLYEESAAIENCNWEFLCPMLWEYLTEGMIPDQRFCNKCQKYVHKVYNEEQLQAAATKGKCVAVFKTPEANEGGYRPGRRMGSYAQLPPKRIPLPYLVPLPDGASNAPINNVIYDDDDLYM